MNDTQKQRLERNLSKSAAGAKPYWVRALTGTSPENQAYINPKVLPIDNTNLGEFYNDTQSRFKRQDDRYNELRGITYELLEEIEDLKGEIRNLKSRLEDLEGFQLD